MPEALSGVLFLFSNGLIWGFIIALIALGLSLIFGVMGIVNMAHGDLYMIGAVISFYVVSLIGSFWLSLVIVPLLMVLIAVPMERFILRPYEGDASSTMIATVGISFIIETSILATYGGIPHSIPDPFPVSFNLFGINYPGYRLLIACISIIILFGVWLFLYKTRFGILIRASIQDRDMASAMGINVNTVLIATFSLGAVLAGVGGVLAAPVYQVSHLMGNDVILLCFIVVIIGGLGSLAGTLTAALGICSFEGILIYFLTPSMARASIFIVMIIVLILRPQGLFGEKEN